MYSREEFDIKAVEFYEFTKKLPSERWVMCDTDHGRYLKNKQIYQIDDDAVNVEVHILYHNSYEVPTLYFKPSYSDGSMMKLDEVIRSFKGIQFDQNTSEIIIQSEHPILFKPFYTFHPCKVTDVMSKFRESENFILTFFTIYGPMIGLKSEIFNKFDLS